MSVLGVSTTSPKTPESKIYHIISYVCGNNFWRPKQTLGDPPRLQSFLGITTPTEGVDWGRDGVYLVSIPTGFPTFLSFYPFW